MCKDICTEALARGHVHGPLRALSFMSLARYWEVSCRRALLLYSTGDASRRFTTGTLNTLSRNSAATVDTLEEAKTATRTTAGLRR